MTKNNLTKAKCNHKVFFIVLGIVNFLILAFIGIAALTYVQNMVETEVYWVLNQDVNAGEELWPDMFEPITTTAGTSPRNAIPIRDVERLPLITRIDLNAGDIITDSTVDIIDH